MPRLPRDEREDAIFHVMVRSIKEVPLFKKDKEQYMNILKGYQKIYSFKIYAYCLMSNHGLFQMNKVEVQRIVLAFFKALLPRMLLNSYP